MENSMDKIGKTLDTIVCVGAGILAGTAVAGPVDICADVEGWNIVLRAAADIIAGGSAGLLAGYALHLWNQPAEYNAEKYEGHDISKADVRLKTLGTWHSEPESGPNKILVVSQFSATGSKYIEVDDYS